MLAIELLLSDQSGETSVLLDPAGDHIVIKHTVDGKGFERDITLPVDSFAYDRAIERAKRGAVFL